jgi:hypothetical protein
MDYFDERAARIPITHLDTEIHTALTLQNKVVYVDGSEVVTRLGTSTLIEKGYIRPLLSVSYDHQTHEKEYIIRVQYLKTFFIRRDMVKRLVKYGSNVPDAFTRSTPLGIISQEGKPMKMSHNRMPMYWGIVDTGQFIHGVPPVEWDNFRELTEFD